VAERNIVVDHKTLTYEGLFNTKDLYQLVHKWFFDKGFDNSEKKNFEHVYPTGKQIEAEMWPWRKMTDYSRMILKVHFLITNIKEVEIVKDGLKKKLNQGKVIMTVNSYHETDYENKWESKALFIFLRTLFDKFVFSVHTGKYDQQIIDETNHLFHLVKGYLNVNRM